MSWLSGIIKQAAEALPHAPAAVEYLASRGVSLELAQRYRIGYAEPDKPVEAATEDWLKWARHHWRGRLVFPLFDALGNVIGMQTRSLVEKDYPVYYAYPSEVYPYMFGLDQALPVIWETGCVVLVEGVFDALAVAPHTPCVIATLRARPSATIRTFLRRYARQVIALLDMDEPGRAGAFSLLEGQEGYTVTMPAYPVHDPADLARQAPEMLERLVGYTKAQRYT